MPRTVALVPLLSLVLLGPAVALAEELREVRFTLGEAVAEALQRNHDVRRAQERITLLGGQIEEVKSQAYPSLGLEAAYSRDYNETILDSLEGFIQPEVTDHYSVRTTLDQLLFSWGKVSAAVDIAELSQTRSAVDLASVERTVTLQVHEAFYRLLLSERLVEVAEERLAQRKRVLDVAKKRFEAGVVNEFEVVRAGVDVANAETPVIQARNLVKQAKSTLNNLLARDQSARIDAVGELEYVPLGHLSLEEVVRRAIENRPELESLRVERQIADRNRAIARADNKPEVSFRAEYGFATEEFENLNPNREAWSAGVFFRMPLFDGWRTRGKVVQAESRLRDVDIATSQLQDTIILEAKIVLDDLAEAQEIIQASSLNIEQAQKALELAETSYQYGVATNLDVSDAQLGLTVAQTDHARALHDYMLASARVRSVMNEL